MENRCGIILESKHVYDLNINPIVKISNPRDKKKRRKKYKEEKKETDPKIVLKDKKISNNKERVNYLI